MIRTWSSLQEYASEREEILAAVDRVFSSGQLVLGENVAAFEQEFTAYCGAHAGVGVGNATDGLFLALKSINTGAGDEIITVANAGVPTVAAIVATGATPVFVDVDPESFLMDVKLLASAMTPRTRAIIPVHLYGQCVPMEEVCSVAARSGIAVIEDCAQAHGASQDGRRAGSFGDLAVFSFYPTKPLGAYGDAGIVLTSSGESEERVKRLRFYGMDDGRIAQMDGYNSRLDEVQAAILRTKLRHLDAYLAKRRKVADRYANLLPDAARRLPAVAAGNQHSFHLYVVRHPDRDQILRRLAAAEIVLTVHYPVPVHMMPAYRGLGYREGSLPVTEQACREVFSLPMYPSLSEVTQATVADSLRRAGFTD